jgi:hypothetical protein
LNGNLMCLQFVTNNSKSFLDDIVDIERRAGPCTRLEMGADIFDHGVRMVSSGHDLPQYFPNLIEVRLDAIKPIQSCVGAGYDRPQWLFDFKGNRSPRRCLRSSAAPHVRDVAPAGRAAAARKASLSHAIGQRVQER